MTGNLHRVRGKKPLAFTLFLIAFAIYLAIFIYRTSIMVDGVRNFVLFDEAMISMNYARNVSHGLGLIWTPGSPRVEGFTNPLWVFWMALLHLLPVGITKISLLVQITGAVVLMGNLIALKKVSEILFRHSWLSWISVILTASYFPLNNWAIQGMEVGILVWIITLGILWAYRFIEDRETQKVPTRLYFLLGIATLVRIDMVLLYLVFAAYLVWQIPGNRRRNLLTAGAILGGVLILQFGLRFWYYGELLPNTYYLKMTGIPLLIRTGRGLYVLLKFAWNFNIILFLVPFMVFFLKPEKRNSLLAAIVIAQILYSVYVGGDAWEHRGGSNRYISLGIPAFFLLFTSALNQIRVGLLRGIGRKSRWTPGLSTGFTWIVVLFSILNFNALLDTSDLKQWLLIDQPMFVKGSDRYVRMSQTIDSITTHDASVAVVTAGIIPYFTGRHAIDIMGKNDPVIARMESRLPVGLSAIAQFRPGHSKWDYAYSIRELRPDIVAQWWDYTTEEIQQVTEGLYTRVTIDGYNFYLLNDSPEILWDRVREKLSR